MIHLKRFGIGLLFILFISFMLAFIFTLATFPRVALGSLIVCLAYFIGAFISSE